MTNKKKNSSKKDSVKNKNIEIKTLSKEIKDLNDKNIKLLAEFDNFQRRTLDEKGKMRKFQNLDVARDLLPAIDDLNRVVEFDQIDSNNSMHEAIKMLQSKIQNILSKHSINCFDSLDTKFDPNLHEALLEQNSDSFKKGKIMEEYEKGYKYHDKIIRHAKVVVSKGKSE
jgi:molecular chaperone GrpE